jgi:hypothetical protein
MVVSSGSEAVDHVREHNAAPAAAALLPGEQARDGCSLENRGWSGHRAAKPAILRRSTGSGEIHAALQAADRI